jgi:DNA polymerase III delta prime subunit
MAVNPFRWTGPIADGVPRAEFARHLALTLKGGVHVAIFGPRGTGKTTFIEELARELALEHGDDAPPWQTLAIDLRTAISIPAFIGAVSAAVDAHPSDQVRRRVSSTWRRLEKEIGVNLGVVLAGIKSSAAQAAVNDEVVLHDQLRALTTVSPRLVIVFDEFQRLNNCPGEPLSIIRTALMGPGAAGRVSLLLTGSLRERLQLMLHTSTEPIWNQTHDELLPDLDLTQLTEYVALAFEATGHAIEPRAVEHVVRLTGGHPKRTQHLAWYVWNAAKEGSPIAEADVQDAFDRLIASSQDNADFAKVLDTLISGTDTDVNDSKALFLLAGGGSPGSTLDARRYGLADEKAVRRAITRLQNRGLVQLRETSGIAVIIDPLLDAWLRRQDPVRLRGQERTRN